MAVARYRSESSGSTLQENAVGSIVDKSASLTNPINDRKALLGFQQSQNKRHLLDLTTKVGHTSARKIMICCLSCCCRMQVTLEQLHVLYGFILQERPSCCH